MGTILLTLSVVYIAIGLIILSTSIEVVQEGARNYVYANFDAEYRTFEVYQIVFFAMCVVLVLCYPLYYLERF